MTDDVILKPGVFAGLKNLLLFEYGPAEKQILRFAQNDVINKIFNTS